MLFSILLTTTLVTGGLARPHNNLEERGVQAATTTVTDVVNVFVTVTTSQSQPTARPQLWFFPDPRTRSKPMFWPLPDPWTRPNYGWPFPQSKTTSMTVSTRKVSSTPVASPTQMLSSTPKVSSTTVASSIPRLFLPPSPSLSSKAPSTASPLPSPKPSSSTPQKASSTTMSPSSPSSSSPPPRASAAATNSPSNSHISGPSQASLTPGSDYQNAILYHHNEARQNHNADPLIWCTDCESNARIAAERCNFSHYIPAGVREGQNLFTTSGPVFNVTAAITESWYKSEFPSMQPYYGQSNVPNSQFAKVGHMTQVVWKGTTSVGCYSLDCGDKMIVNNAPSKLNKFTVCNYYPPGNVMNQFGTNIDRPNSNTSLGSWTD